MTAALLMLLIFVGACLCLWKWRARWRELEREAQAQNNRRYFQQLPGIHARKQEHEWRVGKLFLFFEDGVESGAEVLIRPDLKQAVDTYLVKHPVDFYDPYKDKSRERLLEALRILGLIDEPQDGCWVKAYYDLKRWVAAYHDLMESGKQRGWLNSDGTFIPAMQWCYRGPGVEPGYLNIDGTFVSVRPELVPLGDLDNLNQVSWQNQVLSLRKQHPALSSVGYSFLEKDLGKSFYPGKLKPYADRVLEQPEPANKAEREAKAYAELALRLGAYSSRQSDYWVQRVTEDNAEQIAASAYGLCMYALYKGLVFE